MKPSIIRQLFFTVVSLLQMTYTSFAQTDLKTFDVDVTRISRTITDTSDVSYVIFKINFVNSTNIQSLIIQIGATENSSNILLKKIDISELTKPSTDSVYLVVNDGFTFKLNNIPIGNYYATFSIVTNNGEVYTGQKYFRN